MPRFNRNDTRAPMRRFNEDDVTPRISEPGPRHPPPPLDKDWFQRSVDLEEALRDLLQFAPGSENGAYTEASMRTIQVRHGDLLVAMALLQNP